VAFFWDVRTWAHLSGGLALFGALLVILMFHPGVGGWSVLPSLRYLPFVLYGLAFVLGAVFTQSRVSFVALLLWIVFALTDYNCFVLDDEARGQATIFLSSLYVAWFCALFYRFDERGVFTATGALRGLLILSALLVILLLPALPDISRRLAAPEAGLLRPFSESIRVPRVAVIAFAAGLPFLLCRKPRESPVTGVMYALTVLFVLAGLSFAVSDANGRSGLMLLMSGAGVLLLWSVLESSWRNANMDELTDLPGRRRLRHHLGRLPGGYALAVVDIDHFKKINDRYGHEVGDQVLRWIAATLASHEAGTAYRYGGEEFVLVCEDGTPREIKEDLDDLREAIGGGSFFLRAPDRPRRKPEKAVPARRGGRREKVRVTVSIGFARAGDKHRSAQEVLEAADRQLYRAKKRGRNRVCG